MARPVDHDESQYVAAAVLTAQGLLPYRDFAYLQTPLQPFLMAPLAWAAGPTAWPALRLANALLGAAAVYCTWRAARLVAPAQVAALATALFATCDILLFSAGTARNDALPAACLAGALWLAVRAERGDGSRAQAFAAGLLLAGAAAAKISYALPALAYGGWALLHREHRAAFVALGALPIIALLVWTFALSPAGFLFGVVRFPAQAPHDFYAERPWKLSGWAKAVDLAKFLALGPALAALAFVSRPPRWPPMLALVLAGMIAAAAPTPTWRQYCLPLLPPLFLLLAWTWARRPPSRAWRIAFATCAAAGLAPSAVALANGRPAMLAAWQDGRTIRATMNATGVTGPVATLSPQYLPATGRPSDPRFAPGPFWFRTQALTAPPGLPLLARGDLPAAPLPAAILIGGEDRPAGDDAALDRLLEAEAARRGYRRHLVAGTRFRLWVRP